MTSRTTAIAGALFLALAPMPAVAQTRPGFELGAELVGYRYRERVGGETIVRDHGLLGRLRGSYVETVGRRTFLRAVYDVGTGKVDYRADDATRLDDVSQTVGQLELHVGRDLALGNTTLTLFTGLGGRALFDESGGRTASDGAAGYDRTIGYAFVPLGASIGLPLGRTRLILSGQYDQLFGGSAKSDFSDVDAGLPDVKLRLRGGRGIEVSGILAVPVGGKELRFGPVLRRWWIDRSRSRTFTEPEGSVTVFEPANRTTEFSMRLSLAF